MDAIVAMIGTLVENKAAYAAEGHVLFDTQAYPDYGALSGRPMDEMIAGARVDVAPYKRHPADFVLWKPSKEERAGLGEPLGPGPSRLAHRVLGDDRASARPADRHPWRRHRPGFPAPRERVAQGAARPRPHRFGQLLDAQRLPELSGEKMSKSVGNVALAHELLKTTPGEAIRWALLSATIASRWTGRRS
jgi:cysteinyl-tRNA synthetase